MIKEPRLFYIGNAKSRMEQVARVLNVLPLDEADDVEVEIRQRRKEKTHLQRKTWHGLLRDWGRELGYTTNEMKNVVKRELMGTKVITVHGKPYEIFPSSEDEDRFGYSELIEGTLRLAAEQGVLLEIRRAA